MNSIFNTYVRNYKTETHPAVLKFLKINSILIFRIAKIGPGQQFTKTFQSLRSFRPNTSSLVQPDNPSKYIFLNIFLLVLPKGSCHMVYITGRSKIFFNIFINERDRPAM